MVAVFVFVLGADNSIESCFDQTDDRTDFMVRSRPGHSQQSVGYVWSIRNGKGIVLAVATLSCSSWRRNKTIEIAKIPSCSVNYLLRVMGLVRTDVTCRW